MVRAFPAGFAALLLVSCGSNDVPSPAERLEGASAAEVDESLVTLRTDGLTAGAESFYFSAGKNEVVGALTRTLGAQTGGGLMPECGAGPMESAVFPGGLTANFQDGNFVGWFYRWGGENVVLNDQLGIGTPRGDAEQLPGFAMIEDSTLGEEFAIGDHIGGMFYEGEVSMLYAGTQCFFR